METVLSALVGAFFGVAIYLMLSKHIVRVLLGIAILGNAVNLLIFTAGRLVREAPAIIPEGHEAPVGTVANALPQALILTAIVISFSFFAFLLVLTYRAYQEIGSDDSDGMRIAEPRGESPPPLGY
jgi:multicomponent Na+:H+ antiporter subunit C